MTRLLLFNAKGNKGKKEFYVEIRKNDDKIIVFMANRKDY